MVAGFVTGLFDNVSFANAGCTFNEYRQLGIDGGGKKNCNLVDGQPQFGEVCLFLLGFLEYWLWSVFAVFYGGKTQETEYGGLSSSPFMLPVYFCCGFFF